MQVVTNTLSSGEGNFALWFAKWFVSVFIFINEQVLNFCQIFQCDNWDLIYYLLKCVSTHFLILSSFLSLEQNKFKCDIFYIHTLQVSIWLECIHAFCINVHKWLCSAILFSCAILVQFYNWGYMGLIKCAPESILFFYSLNSFCKMRIVCFFKALLKHLQNSWPSFSFLKLFVGRIFWPLIHILCYSNIFHFC